MIVDDDFPSNSHVIDGQGTNGYYNSGDIDSNWR